MAERSKDEAPIEKEIHQEKARRKARGRRHALLLQREAMGLYAHRDVDRCYPLPPEPKTLVPE